MYFYAKKLKQLQNDRSLLLGYYNEYQITEVIFNMANTCDNSYYDEPSLSSISKNDLYLNENQASKQDGDEIYFTKDESDFSNAKLRLNSINNGKQNVCYSKSPALAKHKKSVPGFYDALSFTTSFQTSDLPQCRRIDRKTFACGSWKTKLIILLTILVIALIVIIVGVNSSGKTGEFDSIE